jgi:hypothetical protein
VAGNRCDKCERPARPSIKADESRLLANNSFSLPTSREFSATLLSFSFAHLFFTDSFISCPFVGRRFDPVHIDCLLAPPEASNRQPSLPLFNSKHVLLSFRHHRFLLHSLPRWPGRRRPPARNGTCTPLFLSSLPIHRPSRMLLRVTLSAKLLMSRRRPSLTVTASSLTSARLPTLRSLPSLTVTLSSPTSVRARFLSRMRPSPTVTSSPHTSVLRRSLPKWPLGLSTV